MAGRLATVSLSRAWMVTVERVRKSLPVKWRIKICDFSRLFSPGAAGSYSEMASVAATASACHSAGISAVNVNACAAPGMAWAWRDLCEGADNGAAGTGWLGVGE